MSALAEEHATMPVLGRLPATATRATNYVDPLLDKAAAFGFGVERARHA